MRYIFIVSRFAAFIVDYIIFYILYYFIAPFGIVGYIFLIIAFFLYRVLLSTYFGSTIGMMLLKLKLLKHDLKTCIKREVYRFASALFYIGYMYALIDRHGRTIHDIASDTIVVYNGSKKSMPESKGYVKILSIILLVISSIRWISFFILNDIGLLGLKKICTSDTYYQSFEGDKLLSLSQDELYLKTLGRKYTTLIEINKKPCIIRISNKLKYTEVYSLNIQGSSITGEYVYTVNLPLQFICSGKFIRNRDLCGISPNNYIVIVDDRGKVYGKNEVKISSIISLKCGDIDNDDYDESIVLGMDGKVEIYKMKGNVLERIYSGKFGEDIIPIAFYIDDGVRVLVKGDGKSILYHYKYVNKKFVFESKKYIKTKDVGNIQKYNHYIILSHIIRNNMIFKRGTIQNLEVYNLNDKITRLYNFGKRPGRRYDYSVRCLEDVYDIDGDEEDEMILKSVKKDDVMGQMYKIEIYKPLKELLYINRILSFFEDILY
ncbi:RDD family protein [Caloramator sp. E03]|uniref:RDD family protein n=1 Tax=Caloramator sp. E03 TaxID=2576307 RepID=UPI001110F7E6|nr:RDD family protein [Caloramator sp. E03]QCX33463.1 RDD family protein [Caloramator sp. E03]